NHDPAELRSIYSGQEAFAHDLLTRGLGATIAFLVKTAQLTEPSGTSCACPKGQGRFGVDAVGILKHSADCLPCGEGVFEGMPLWLDGQCVVACPHDRPFEQDGACVSLCTGTAPCTGISCPADRPFIENDQCVAQCANGGVVVNRRECQ